MFNFLKKDKDDFDLNIGNSNPERKNLEVIHMPVISKKSAESLLNTKKNKTNTQIVSKENDC